MNYDKLFPINLRVGDEFRQVNNVAWYKVRCTPITVDDRVCFVARHAGKDLDIDLPKDIRVVRRKKCCEYCGSSVSFGNGYKIGELYYCSRVCQGANEIMKEANG